MGFLLTIKNSYGIIDYKVNFEEDYMSKIKKEVPSGKWKRI